MHIQRVVIIFCCLALAFAVETERLQAVPLPPTTLWGRLTLDGVPAPDGTPLYTQIGGIQYAATVVGTHNGQSGLYSIDVPADDPFTPEVEGGQSDDIIVLTGEGVAIAETAIWEIGAVQNLDLTGIPFAVDLSCDHLSGMAPLTVNCTYTAFGTVTSWLWDFGDGATSDAGEPTHVYTMPGVYTLRLTVSGPAGNASRTASNYITVTTPQPTADAGGPYTVTEGGSITLNGTGSDPTGVYGPLTYSWDLNEDGSFETAGQHPTFDAAGLGGPTARTVRLRVTNSAGGFANDTATVTVHNAAPSAVDDSWVTGEDSVLTIPAPGVLANDNDPGGDSLQVVNHDGSAHGAAVSIAANGELRYDPTVSASLQALAQGKTAVDAFSYTIDDDDGAQDTATVRITVTGANDAPVAADDRATTAEDQAVNLLVLANDEDMDADSLVVIMVGPVSHGTVNNLGTHVLYTPAANFTGADSFVYTVSDGNASDSATVTITVGPINDPPVALEDTSITDEDTPLIVGRPGLLANDHDPDGDTLSIISYQSISALGASVHVNASGGYQYDPTGSSTIQAMAAGTTLNDTFMYTVTDPAGLTALARVNITISGMNDIPHASNGVLSVSEISPIGTVVGVVVGTDPDTDDHLGYAITTGNDNAAFAIDAESGQLSVAGALDFECWVSYELEVQVMDRQGQATVAMITIQVIDADDEPSACGLVEPTLGGNVSLVVSGLEIEAVFPPDAVSEPVTLVIQQANGRDIPDNLRLVGQPFVISALTQNGEPMTDLSHSYTLTIDFGESWLAREHNEAIGLYRWDTSASQYLEAGSTIDVQPGRVVAVLDQLGEFALLESTSQQIYLPNIRPNAVQPITCMEPVTQEKIWVGDLTVTCDITTMLDDRPAVKLHSSVPSIAELYSPLLPVQPNIVYRLSYSVKTALTVQGAEIYGKVIVAQYNSQARETDQVDQNRLDPGFTLGESVGGESDWVTKSYTFQTTAGTTYVRLRAVLGGPVGTAQGSMWVTNIQLSPEQ